MGRSAADSRSRRTPWERIAIGVVLPASTLLTHRRWIGQQHIPDSGGVVLAANHISYIDPLLLGHFVWSAGRFPRYLAKSTLFDHRLAGPIFRGASQIPVYRGSENASAALRDAVAAVRQGEAVLIYPEGTITKDPEFWPMLAHTGVARLALETRAPVIPIAQWGAQRIWRKGGKPRPLPPKSISISAGPPLDLTRWDGQPASAGVLREITDDLMGRIRAQLAELRGEPAPTEVFDPRAGERHPQRTEDPEAKQGPDV